MWSDLSSCEARGGIETDTISTCGAIDFDFTRVGSESFLWIFSRDSTLDRITSLGDAVLCETELRQRSTSCDLDLGGNDVDAGDLLRDGVLDLDTGCKKDKECASAVDQQSPLYSCYDDPRLISMK